MDIQVDDIIDSIAQTEWLIRPHIPRTPVIEVDAADFGLGAGRFSFKLELLQHAGSFKTRGAFTNLLTREIPRAFLIEHPKGLALFDTGLHPDCQHDPAARLVTNNPFVAARSRGGRARRRRLLLLSASAVCRATCRIAKRCWLRLTGWRRWNKAALASFSATTLSSGKRYLRPQSRSNKADR